MVFNVMAGLGLRRMPSRRTAPGEEEENIVDVPADQPPRVAQHPPEPLHGKTLNEFGLPAFGLRPGSSRDLANAQATGTFHLRTCMFANFSCLGAPNAMKRISALFDRGAP